MNEKTTQHIPFFIPDVGEAEASAMAEVIRSGWITTGARTAEFEKALAAYLGAEQVACLSSQTASAEMTLRLLGIGPGDEVITSAYTYTATAEVIAHVGAKPVLIDTAPDSYEMDYDAAENAITERTKVIIPVDIAGVPCDYTRIFEIAEKKRSLFRPGNEIQRAFGRVIVLADAAHALGAERNGQRAGTLADITCFSMHAVKNLTTAEGGAVTWRAHKGIDLEKIFRRYRLLSLHGQSKDAFMKSGTDAWEYDIAELGYKCNMTDLTAAFGLVQLSRFDAMQKRRFEIIRRYDAVLKPAGILTLAHTGADYSSAGHLYLTRVPGISEQERNALIRKMDARGIVCNVHYMPLPMLTAYRALGFDIKDYPNAFGMYKNEITLPLYTKLTDEQVDLIADTYRELVRGYM